MAMTFFAASTTPLFAAAWTPRTAAQYAGTCIFLIAFAAVFRALLAVRVHFYPLLRGFDAHQSGAAAGQVYQEKVGSQWRAREAVLLAFVDVLIATVGYLL